MQNRNAFRSLLYFTWIATETLVNRREKKLLSTLQNSQMSIKLVFME